MQEVDFEALEAPPPKGWKAVAMAPVRLVTCCARLILWFVCTGTSSEMIGSITALIVQFSVWVTLTSASVGTLAHGNQIESERKLTIVYSNFETVCFLNTVYSIGHTPTALEAAFNSGESEWWLPDIEHVVWDYSVRLRFTFINIRYQNRT